MFSRALKLNNADTSKYSRVPLIFLLYILGAELGCWVLDWGNCEAEGLDTTTLLIDADALVGTTAATAEAGVGAAVHAGAGDGVATPRTVSSPVVDELLHPPT